MAARARPVALLTAAAALSPREAAARRARGRSYAAAMVAAKREVPRRESRELRAGPRASARGRIGLSPRPAAARSARRRRRPSAGNGGGRRVRGLLAELPQDVRIPAEPREGSAAPSGSVAPPPPPPPRSRRRGVDRVLDVVAQHNSSVSPKPQASRRTRRARGTRAARRRRRAARGRGGDARRRVQRERQRARPYPRQRLVGVDDAQVPADRGVHHQAEQP